MFRQTFYQLSLLNLLLLKKRPQCRGLQGVHLRIRLFKKVEIYIKQNQKIDKKEN